MGMDENPYQSPLAAERRPFDAPRELLAAWRRSPQAIKRRQRLFYVFVAATCLEAVHAILDQFPDWVAERAFDATVVAGVAIASLLFVRWIRSWRHQRAKCSGEQ